MKYTHVVKSFDFHSTASYKLLLETMGVLGVVYDRNMFKELEHTHQIVPFYFFTKLSALGFTFTITNVDKFEYVVTNGHYTFHISDNTFELYIDDNVFNIFFSQPEDILETFVDTIDYKLKDKYRLIDAKLYNVGFVNRPVTDKRADAYRVVILCDDIRKSLYKNKLTNNKTLSISLRNVYTSFVQKQFDWMIE